MINFVIQFQIARIKNNLITFLLIVLTAIIIFSVSYKQGSLKQSVAYLFVMWLCSFFIDFYALRRPAKNDFTVRNPKRETIYFLVCFIGGLLFLFFRFSGILDWEHTNPLLRLSIASLIIFAFPIALTVIMLLLKYKPTHLGLRLQGLIIVIPIIAISAITNRIVLPQSLTWNAVISEGGGIMGALFTGFILSGLSEEFFRTIGQTRLAAFIGNKGLGWFITTLIWSLFHAPKWYGESHDIIEALLSSIRIIPIGLMWGYITHRTKSFLPAVIVHGTNFWGLQNF